MTKAIDKYIEAVLRTHRSRMDAMFRQLWIAADLVEQGHHARAAHDRRLGRRWLGAVLSLLLAVVWAVWSYQQQRLDQ